MGLTRFSMSPSFVPSIKQLASQLSMQEAQQIVDAVMKFTTIAQVNTYMTRVIGQIAPNLKMLAAD
jgi:phosphotransferase system enzyme I (PtsI)